MYISCYSYIYIDIFQRVYFAEAQFQNGRMAGSLVS